MEEIANYAALLDLGKPDFIEIKGVTYCGSSGASSLTMQNVPYHADVCQFGEAICAARNGEYGLACEHAHSCCILLARKDRFWKEGRWHTWIDYDKFQVGGQFILQSLDVVEESQYAAVYTYVPLDILVATVLDLARSDVQLLQTWYAAIIE